MNTITYRFPVRMLCDRNQQASRISSAEMIAKLGCSNDLYLGGRGGMLEPSSKFFIYYEPVNTGAWMCNKFRLVEVDGLKETTIDEGQAEGLAHNHGADKHTKFGIRGTKLGQFQAYVPFLGME